MKNTFFLLVIINSFLALAQKKPPKKPNNLTFSHLIKKKVNTENGKIIYLRKSTDKPLDSEEPYNITKTYLNENTDIVNSYISTKLIMIGSFNKGYKNGFWKTNYKNKLVKTENWNMGLRVGKYRVYNTKGDILYKTTFGPKGNGKYKDFYYTTAILKQEGSYKNGKKAGEWCDYDEQGNTKKVTHYNNGVPVR